MRISELKKGEIYAYIPEYDSHSARTEANSLWCDADKSRPVEMLGKEVRDVVIGTDTCGRPITKRKTFILVKQYDITATHPLALDLDVVEKRHSDLVHEVEFENAKNIVWQWTQEVETLRKRAKNMKYLGARLYFFKGMSYRSLRWLSEKNEALIRRTCVDNSDHKPLRPHDNSEYDSLKHFLWWMLTDKHSQLRTTFNLQVSIGDSTSSYYYSAHPYGIFTRVRFFGAFSHPISMGEYLYSTLEFPIKNTLKYNPESSTQMNLLRELWGKMTDEQQLEAVDNTLNFARKQIETHFGRRLPTFKQGAKNWEKWSETEYEDLLATLNEYAK